MTAPQSLNTLYLTLLASLALAGSGCCRCANQTFVTVSEAHQPKIIMGRDCWRMLTKYYEYSWSGKEEGIDNPDVENHPALTDVIPAYSAFNQPPSKKSGLTTWPHLKDNFTKGSPALEIIESNPQPNRPFVISNWSERRGRDFWGSEPTLDQAEYDAWRAKHPNLLTDGNLGEWCNDLSIARNAKSETLKAFLGEAPKTRYDQLALLKRYYDMRKARNYNGTMAVLDAHLNTLHIAADFGASLVRLESTASGQYRYQPSAMFIRGAARQFSIPWEWFIAGYVNGPSKTRNEYLGDVMCRYPLSPNAKAPFTHYAKEARKATWCPGGTIRVGNGGPDFGISRSLFKRTHYMAYLSGANIIALEEWRNVLKMRDFEKGKTVFSPRGEIYCAFTKFITEHPDRGAHYSPVAVCVPIAQGYPTWGGTPFATPSFGYTAGDRAVDAVFFTLVPGCDYGACMARGEETCMRNSPFADMYDVVAPDVKSQTREQVLNVLKNYKALVITGDYPDKTWESALKAYEEAGGEVIRVDKAMLADAVKSGKGRGASTGEERYPKLEKTLHQLEEKYFPFAVSGACAYGLSVAQQHCWLYVFNHDGIIKYADAPEEVDATKASDVRIALRAGFGKMQRVKELLTAQEIKLARDESFTYHLAPGELAIFEIK